MPRTKPKPKPEPVPNVSTRIYLQLDTDTIGRLRRSAMAILTWPASVPQFVGWRGSGKQTRRSERT